MQWCYPSVCLFVCHLKCVYVRHWFDWPSIAIELGVLLGQLNQCPTYWRWGLTALAIHAALTCVDMHFCPFISFVVIHGIFINLTQHKSYKMTLDSTCPIFPTIAKITRLSRTSSIRRVSRSVLQLINHTGLRHIVN